MKLDAVQTALRVRHQAESEPSKTAAELLIHLTSVEKLSLPTDLWTALRTQLYVTVTCHYVHSWDLQCAAIQTKVMPDQSFQEHLNIQAQQQSSQP